LKQKNQVKFIRVPETFCVIEPMSTVPIHAITI
jgi:hypothetical protein